MGLLAETSTVACKLFVRVAAIVSIRWTVSLSSSFDHFFDREDNESEGLSALSFFGFCAWCSECVAFSLFFASSSFSIVERNEPCECERPRADVRALLSTSERFMMSLAAAAARAG